MLKPGWHSRISFLTDVSCGGNEVRVMNTDEMSCVCVCVCVCVLHHKIHSFIWICHSPYKENSFSPEALPESGSTVLSRQLWAPTLSHGAGSEDRTRRAEQVDVVFIHHSATWFSK